MSRSSRSARRARRAEQLARAEAEVQELRARYAASSPTVRRLIEAHLGRRLLAYVPADPQERDAAKARVFRDVLRYYARIGVLRARPVSNPEPRAYRDAD